MSYYPSWYTGFYQLNLFGGKANKENYRLSCRNTGVLVGQYFEILASRIIKNSVLTDTAEGNNPDITSPDIICEVKASNKGFLCDIDQIERYSGYKKPAYYFLFAYKKDENPLYCSRDSIQLIKLLSATEKSLLVLPVAFLKKLMTYLKIYDYKIWRSSGEHYIRFSPTLFKYFLNLDLKNLFNVLSDGELDPSAFKFTPFKTRKINLGYTVCRPFNGIFIDSNETNFNLVFNRRIELWKNLQ